ncbi:hypothetical protein [Streptomyces zaomyceticus]|uniref:hypothetical protein n=1 Tax=Streptomyces zaomyceticus TaxID=68286 RepID=UPI00341CFA42
MFRFLGTARLVVVGRVISYRARFNRTTPPMFIGTPLVGPLFQVLFRAFPGGEPVVVRDRFPLVGNAVPAASASVGYGGTTAVADERRYGTRPPPPSAWRCPPGNGRARSRAARRGRCPLGLRARPRCARLRFRDVFLVTNVARSVLLLLTGVAAPRETPPWRRATLDTM